MVDNKYTFIANPLHVDCFVFGFVMDTMIDAMEYTSKSNLIIL